MRVEHDSSSQEVTDCIGNVPVKPMISQHGLFAAIEAYDEVMWRTWSTTVPSQRDEQGHHDAQCQAVEAAIGRYLEFTR